VLAHTKRKLDDDVALLLVEAAPVRPGPGRPHDDDRTAALTAAGAAAGAA
jgi:hypothetical protein